MVVLYLYNLYFINTIIAVSILQRPPRPRNPPVKLESYHFFGIMGGTVP